MRARIVPATIRRSSRRAATRRPPAVCPALEADRRSAPVLPAYSGPGPRLRRRWRSGSLGLSGSLPARIRLWRRTGPLGSGTSTMRHSISGHVERRGNEVERERSCPGAAVVDDVLLVERVAETHHRTALHLALDAHRVDRAARIGGGHESRNLNEPGLGIDLDFGQLRRPPERLIRIALRGQSDPHPSS